MVASVSVGNWPQQLITPRRLSWPVAYVIATPVITHNKTMITVLHITVLQKVEGTKITSIAIL